MLPPAGVDLPELPVPLIQVPLELLLTAGVARLPVAPGPHVGHRLGQVQAPERGLDVLPLLGRGNSAHTGSGLAASPNNRATGYAGYFSERNW